MLRIFPSATSLLRCLRVRAEGMAPGVAELEKMRTNLQGASRQLEHTESMARLSPRFVAKLMEGRRSFGDLSGQGIRKHDEAHVHPLEAPEKAFSCAPSRRLVAGRFLSGNNIHGCQQPSKLPCRLLVRCCKSCQVSTAVGFRKKLRLNKNPEKKKAWLGFTLA